jgi:membrane-bound ClpP family serine protease
VAHPGSAQGNSGGPQSTVPWWNAFSIMVFITWFGATGYLLTRHENFAALIVLVLSALAGFGGGAIVFFFMTKVLLPHERELTDFETAVEGVVGRVSAPIREGGIGEVVYEQLGARKAVPARSEHGAAIKKGEEVFVTRYEKGVAWVRRWEELESSDEARST